MQITNIAAYVVPGEDRKKARSFRKPLVFVRLETKSGVVGWGEAYSLTHRASIIASFVAALSKHVIGQQAFDTRQIIEVAKNRFGEQQLGMDLFAAASAIEIAAWDAVGRYLNTPIYKLLGGPCHDDIPLYVNLFSKTPRSAEELAQEALKKKARGFTAAKLYPFHPGETLDQAVATIGVVRDAVGSDFGLAVDIWRFASQVEALEICTALSQFDLLWVEDPFDTVHRSSLKRLRQRIKQPLVAGETLAGKQAFHELFASNAVDWTNPDVCSCGGIAEFRDIATLADVHHLRVCPHNFSSMTIGLAATAHAAIGIPNLELTEYFPAIEDHLDEMCDNRLKPLSGRLQLPDMPGLGVELDSGVMERHRVAS